MPPTTGRASLVHTSTAVLSLAPVRLPAPGRAAELQVRVSVPANDDGRDLPIVLLSHGAGPSRHLPSLYGYAPLADHWAAQGFAVIQPTHLNSPTLQPDPAVSAAPDAPLHWRSRTEDMKRVLDGLDVIEAAVPGLRGRLDRKAVAVAGHSLGGHTASLLLGARLTDPRDGRLLDLADPRITAGVLLAAPGRGGDALTADAATHHPVLLGIDFSTMAAPALVVAGDRDDSPHLTPRGPDWHADPYHLSPGPKSLLTLFGAEHGLGGIAGYDAAETTAADTAPELLAAVRRLTTAYLRSALRPGDPAWERARETLAAEPRPAGRIDAK
ncbi:alpha/beta hydrolase family protein [Kitasatospora sp. NPDC006697]|uniref:alpha/beta hydrolase family protein n=1 Tax=Kitasatospora sp. NPDC006697 TaxID=3364020 RepID=UPI0036C38506